MTAGPYTALSALTLTAAEKASGYTNSAYEYAGPDVQGLLTAALNDLEAAAIKLTAINAVLPGGSNKTALGAQLTILTATS